MAESQWVDAVLGETEVASRRDVSENVLSLADELEALNVPLEPSAVENAAVGSSQRALAARAYLDAIALLKEIDDREADAVWGD